MQVGRKVTIKKIVPFTAFASTASLLIKELTI